MSSSRYFTEDDRGCPFLELPGEMRNMIYAYALFEPAGLRFRLDEHGIGRLESIPPAKISCVTVAIATCSSRPTDEKEELTKASLRVANQLQYVNHELRDETRGLNLRYNDISFDYLRDALAFIKICPGSEIQYLRTLSVRKGLYSTVGAPQDNLLGPPDERYTQLFNFCVANPSITVYNPVIGWRQTDPMFVPYAILVQMQFRRSSSRIADFFTDPTIQDQVRTVTSRKVGNMEEALPANFKIFPEDEIFDAALFKKTCVGDVMISNFFDRAVEGGIERWVTEVRKIYEHGI